MAFERKIIKTEPEPKNSIDDSGWNSLGQKVLKSQNGKDAIWQSASSSGCRKLALMLGAIVLLALSASAQTFDSATSFSSMNPNGPWTYGAGTVGTSLTPFNMYIGANCGSTAGLSCWEPTNTSLGTPDILINTTNSTLNLYNPANNTYRVYPPGLLIANPGPSTDAIVQWKAPASGTYAINGFFELLDSAPTGVICKVFNGSTQLYSQTLTAPGATNPNGVGARTTFSLIQTVAAGAIISFGVNNDGSYFNDSTGIEAVIAPATPTPSISGVVSASGFGGFSVVAPGSFIEAYGSNLASDTRGWASSDFKGNSAPTSLDGTSATIDGQPAFVNYISPGQLDLQVPSNVLPGQRPLVVTTAAGTSSAYTLNVNATEPGLLAPSSFVVGGKQYVVGIFPDGTYALPPGAINGVASRRAKPGDVMVFYGVGFGPVTPTIPAGQIAQQSSNLVNNLQLSFGGMVASIQYSGLAPGFVGLYQFNVTVPNVPASDLVPLTLTLGATAGSQTLYTAVQN